MALYYCIPTVPAHGLTHISKTMNDMGSIEFVVLFNMNILMGSISDIKVLYIEMHQSNAAV